MPANVSKTLFTVPSRVRFLGIVLLLIGNLALIFWLFQQQAAPTLATDTSILSIGK